MPLAPTNSIILSAPCDQGNIRQVTDADGKVEQDNHYYPYGMLMAESSDILAGASGSNANPYLYGAKEYLTTAGANLLDFTARTYDPSTLLFHTQDPNSGDYTPFLPYLYCGSDPVNRIDPDGREWEIEEIRDKNGLKVNIRITGVLLNLSSECFDMEALNSAIKEQLEFVYSYQQDGISVNMTADIRLVKSVNDILVSDHVFMVVDQSYIETANAAAETIGYMIKIGTRLATQTISGENQRSIAHELGHSGGLRDVNKNRNNLEINDPNRNLMTQAKALPKGYDKNTSINLEPAQINQLIDNYNKKNQIVDMNPYSDLKPRVNMIRKTLRNKKIRNR